MSTTIEINTKGPGLYEFTQHLRPIAQGDGLLNIFLRHTSCSLLVQENADPDVRIDLQYFFRRLVPSSDDPSMTYLRHTYEGPDDMPAHIKASMMPVSLNIPVISGQLGLGTWQGVYLFEHRQSPHLRQIILTMITQG